MPPLPTHQSPRRVRSLFFPWRRRGLGWCWQPATPGAASAARAWPVPQRPRWVCPAGCAPRAQAEPAGERAPEAVRAPDDEGAPAWWSAPGTGTVLPEAACALKSEAQPAPPAGLPRLAEVRRSATLALPAPARRDPGLGPGARPLSLPPPPASPPPRAASPAPLKQRLRQPGPTWRPLPPTGVRARAGRGLPKGGRHSPSAPPAPRALVPGTEDIGERGGRVVLAARMVQPPPSASEPRASEPGAAVRDAAFGTGAPTEPPAPRTTRNRAPSLPSSAKAGPRFLLGYPSAPG
uniref:Basic proline-rich protein-like n=1 Tax=Tursiops truncatus TaxID=9739 RepID=A0A2U4A150_TURTR|nr:basic proline-rich protein-like [Tursiops truncatus]